jgi:tellurite resistance protein TehA-like permease
MWKIVIVLLEFDIYIAVPAVIVWGWLRWTNLKKQWTAFPILSLVGFAVATISGLLAITGAIFARAVGGFSFFNPTLLEIYWCGPLLSVTGMIFAIIGLWRPNSLRWHAPICAFGTLLFWIAMATAE